MAGQRHPTGYMRRAICDKQKSFSSYPDPPSPSVAPLRVLQQGDYLLNAASWRAQALRAGRTWHEDGHPFGALRGESSWQSLSLCKVLPSVLFSLFFPLIGRRTWNFIGWLPLRQDRRHATITRHFMASSGDENSPGGGEKGENRRGSSRNSTCPRASEMLEREIADASDRAQGRTEFCGIAELLDSLPENSDIGRRKRRWAGRLGSVPTSKVPAR